MSTRAYLITCVIVTAVWVPTLLFVPVVSDAVEQLMLWFLSTNAR